MSSAIHNWLLEVRVPLSTSLPFLVMVQDVLLNHALHPSSHSCPTEQREPDAKDKKIWA